MKLNLKLSQWALLLVVVPVLFELVFISILVSLVNALEVQTRSLSHAKAVISTVDAFRQKGYEAGITLFIYGSYKSQSMREKFEACIPELNKQVDTLEQLTKADPVEREIVGRIKSSNQEAVSVMKQVQEEIEQQTGVAALISSDNARKRLKRFSERTTKDLRDLIKIEKSKSSTPEDEELARQRLKQFILLGIPINLVVAFSLLLLSRRGLARRMNILMNNTARLSSKMSLLQPIGGTDELGELDRVFHEMADTLEEAARKEKAIEEMKQEFVAMITHDLRTPLASVRATLELLSERATLEEHWHKRVQGAEQSCERLISLINDLLDLEKMRSGKLSLELDIHTIDGLINRSVETVQSFADANKITIENQKSELLVIADSRRMIQVLINLLSNAIKFSPQNTKITITAALIDQEVEVRIQDQGSGIDQKHIESIFGRFEQITQLDDRDKRGSGLGLAICKMIVEQHKGTIGVVSPQGAGSTFWFRVPAAL